MTNCKLLRMPWYQIQPELQSRACQPWECEGGVREEYKIMRTIGNEDMSWWGHENMSIWGYEDLRIWGYSWNSPDEATMRMWRKGERRRGIQQLFILSLFLISRSLTITIWRLSFFTLCHFVEDIFCIVYCKSLLFSRSFFFRAHKQRKAGFGADYQDKNLSKLLKAPSVHKEVKDQKWPYSEQTQFGSAGCNSSIKVGLELEQFFVKTKKLGAHLRLTACSRWSRAMTSQ